MFKFFTFSVLFVLSTIFVSFGQVQVLYPTEIISAVNHDLSIPLREMEEMPLTPTPWVDGIIPLRDIPTTFNNEYKNDPALQLFNGIDGGGNILENFDGVGAQGFAPPDVSGDVGPNHYMQMVNVRFQIWDKSGNSLLGPFNLGTIWAGFPGPWQSSLNDGDPVVLYDDLADRWIATQFSLPSGGTYLLVAVSQTSDPTGAWYRYGFQTAQFPDYPKFGVWPDGYYFSANRFAGGFQGTYAGVMERDKMLIGDPADMVIFSVPSSMSASLLPADCDGTTPPPAGAPNYFVQAFAGGLDVFELQVDWANPGSSTFTGPLAITTSSYGPVNGIPQMGTSNLLDDLSFRLMQRLQYRNFGTHETLVACHTINSGGGRAGMRWYELRNPSGWSLYQEGTYAPADNIHRWMGSIAMNASGEIALGYSASSSTIFPDIRFTGRKDGDPLGVMTATEEVIFSSSGFQAPLSRWGDYTTMSVDPDGQTFWYTNEYQPSSGQFNWRTRIASFNFDPPPPCSVGAAFNPNPPAGAINIPLNEPTLSWENGLDATEIEVIFDGVSIYSGPLVTSVPMPPLSSGTTYLWKVNSSDGVCTTFGPNWTFTTIVTSEPLMSLIHTPGDLNVGIFNDGSIGAENTGFTGPGVTWLGVNGLFVGGPLFGSASTMSVNGMIGSFSIVDIQNVTSNFAGGFTSDVNFDQITEATLDDGLAPTPFGVEITQRSYSHSGVGEEFVFIRYGFTNTTGSMIPSAVGGIFIDWDIDVNTFGTNSGGYTLFNNVVYEFGTVTPEYYFGIASLDGASGMRTTTSNAGSRTDSYNYITTFDPAIDPNGDFRSWVGTPLGDIGPGETVWTTFAIIAGISLSELETYAIQASIKAFSLGWTGIIIPVELTSFTAVDNNGQVILNWATATELNNQMFEIERRTEEGQYVTIGYVDGHGTTTEPQEYSFIDNSSLTGTFFYRLKQIDFGGRYEYSDEIEVEVTGPLAFELGQNYPNPFNPSTSIKYSIPESGFVTLDVYNLLGEKVTSLVNGVQEAGRYEINFDASNLASGIYVYSLRSGSFNLVKKMLLMK